MTGFEPATAGSEVQRAIQLRHMVIFYLCVFCLQNNNLTELYLVVKPLIR